MNNRLAILAFLSLAVLALPACEEKGQAGLEEMAGDQTGQQQPDTPSDQSANAPAPAETPLDLADLKELPGRAREVAREFAQRSDERFSDLAGNRFRGWIVFAVMALVGAVSLLYGWTILKSFMVPFAPVWGLSLGAITAFCLIRSFYTDYGHYSQLAILGAGSVFGLSVFLFAALKAKPIAAFLVVLAPFLVAAAFLLDTNSKLGIVIFIIGFIAGFAAMIEVRPMSIISTSLLGSLLLVGAYGLLSHLLSGGSAVFLRDSFKWMLGNPLMLIIAILVLAFLGTNYQFATGPRGTIEE